MFFTKFESKKYSRFRIHALYIAYYSTQLLIIVVTLKKWLPIYEFVYWQLNSVNNKYFLTLTNILNFYARPKLCIVRPTKYCVYGLIKLRLGWHENNWRNNSGFHILFKLFYSIWRYSFFISLQWYNSKENGILSRVVTQGDKRRLSCNSSKAVHLFSTGFLFIYDLWSRAVNRNTRRNPRQ